MDQFYEMMKLVRLGVSRDSRGPIVEIRNISPRLGHSLRRYTGIVIQESEGRRQQREEDNDNEVDPTDLRGKGPMVQMKKENLCPRKRNLGLWS